jgi:hypothetical protein
VNIVHRKIKIKVAYFLKQMCKKNVTNNQAVAMTGLA